MDILDRTNQITPFDQVEYMERLDRMKQLEFREPMDTMEGMERVESFDMKVERIARAWFADTGPDHDFTPLNWDLAHPEDKSFAVYMVAFVLDEAGVE